MNAHPDASNRAASFLSGGGEMGERIRAFDWAKTPLGPVERWSEALRTTVRIVLANRFPQLIWWGPDFIQIYNDAYAPVPGAKHPSRALGLPGRECWAEIWDVIGPLVERPFRGGPPTWDEDILLEVRRHGFTEESHFTIAYSPVPDDSAPGGIGGVLGTVHEITEKVVAERRTVVLRDLAARVGDAKTAEESCAIAAHVLAAHDKDIPFALIYLIDPEHARARLAGAAHVAPGTEISPLRIDLDSSDNPWPLGLAINKEQVQVVEDLGARFSKIPRGPWSDPPKMAVVVPIPSNKSHEPAGLMILGISSRLRFDERYRDFLDLVKTQVATAIANARSYEEERKRAESLAELDRAKTIFFSNVSHEFRTPLTLMLGPIEDLLQRGYEDLSTAARTQLEVVNRNGLRLLRLVNTLLDFSRIEAGRVRATYRPTDLAGLTADLSSVFRAAIEHAGLKLIVNCPKLPEPVYVDREMWEKIVLNLLSNAFKFTLRGQIEVSLRIANSQVELRVIDTGIGIPAKELPRLFERFHRVENAQGRTHEGSGIGLALVQELVRLHGGSIGAESVAGEGTTFIVRIPTGLAHLPKEQISSEDIDLSGVPEAIPFVQEALRWLPDRPKEDARGGLDESDYRDELAAPISKNDAPRARVLVADDNADMRQYVTRLLIGRYQIECVSDGITAFVQAREWKPDLILTDIMMPRLDGFGLLRRVREDTDLRETPVIMLSARAGEESRVEGLDAGADDYLVKPFSARELIARVEVHLKMALMRREAAEHENLRNHQFEIVVNRAPLGIFLVDSAFRIRLVNPIALPVFGDIPNLVGRDFGAVMRIIWNREYADEIVRRFRHTLQSGESYETPERSELRADRNVTEYYEWRIDRTLLPDGKFGIICYFRDISAQVMARRQLEESRDALRRDAYRKTEFISLLAHELRNPLAPIANSIELLKRYSGDERSQALARSVIERQLSHMVRLIDDLLDMSRITQNKLNLRLERITLETVIEHAIEVCRPPLDKFQHRLVTEFSTGPVYLDADPVRLVQVFQNLVNNACKFTENGGTITITTVRKQRSVVVTVRDTGIGIPREDLSEVFEMFSQLHSDRSRAGGGLGIGLALAKRLVELHRGEIEAHSEGIGKGSQFVVRLPLPALAKESDSVALSNGHSEEPQLLRRRILVVEDNPDSAETMAELLRTTGNFVRTVNEGQTALEAIESFDPHIVLLDIGLPDMNGYEVCQAIRQNGARRQPVIVALTGWGQEQDRKKSLASGFDYHLVKPVSFQNLLEVVTRLGSGNETTG
jgi:signal transduction histidine kinase